MEWCMSQLCPVLDFPRKDTSSAKKKTVDQNGFFPFLLIFEKSEFKILSMPSTQRAVDLLVTPWSCQLVHS